MRRRYEHGPHHYDAEFDVERRILVVWLNRVVSHRTAVGADGMAGSLPPWLPRDVQAQLVRDLAGATAARRAPGPRAF